MILVGASVRAAAWSARRAGWTPLCLDLFGDLDLGRAGASRTIAVEDYPHGFLRLLEDVPPRPIVYTGALENRPNLIARLAERFPLWGNGPDVLRRVRSPRLLHEALVRAGLPAPRVSDEPAGGGRWLLKPRAGGGGTGIAPWDGAPFGKSHYLQEWLDGWSWAAIYVGAAGAQAHFLGVTRQLVGESWLHAAPFHYCGSVGPLPISERQQAYFEQIGQTLVTHFKLRGLFGVDGIMQDEVPFPVEINPRYTASMEVIELALGRPLLRDHAAAFDETIAQAPGPGRNGGVLGKCILFADRKCAFPTTGPWNATLSDDIWTLPKYGDIPRAGQKFPVGQPIMTVFGKANTVDECVQCLRTGTGTINIGVACAARET